MKKNIFAKSETEYPYSIVLQPTSKQKVGHCDKTMLQIFYIFTILNTYVPLIFPAKIQPKISSGSGEKVGFVIFAIFSNGGHLGYST